MSTSWSNALSGKYTVEPEKPAFAQIAQKDAVSQRPSRKAKAIASSWLPSSSSLMGSLAKVFLRKFAEILRKFRVNSSGKGALCRNSAESLQKFRGNFAETYCNDPFPNNPISDC